MMRIHWQRKLLVLVCCLYSFAPGEAAQTPGWKVDWEATIRAAEKEGQLVIYGPRGRDQEILYSEIFAKSFPKIHVQYTAGRLSH